MILYRYYKNCENNFFSLRKHISFIKDAIALFQDKSVSEEITSDDMIKTSDNSTKKPSSNEQHDVEEDEEMKRRSLLFKMGLRDLSRLEASRMRSRPPRAIMDVVLDPIWITNPATVSLLSNPMVLMMNH